MKAGFVHYFYAHDWPMKLWFIGIPLLFPLGVIFICKPTLALFSEWRYMLHFGIALIVSIPLGFFVGLIIGWPVLGSLYHDRCLKNGGPFHEGDIVRILVGPHKGRVVRVYSTWRWDTVRVELGDSEKETSRDIFSQTQLLREDDSAQKQKI